VVVGTPSPAHAGAAPGFLWTLFARQIYAVPAPAVSVAPLALVAPGTILLANLAAAMPGRRAARTPSAAALRAE
jgi:ABC-type lipoprotein release transport system permease subunit